MYQHQPSWGRGGRRRSHTADVVPGLLNVDPARSSTIEALPADVPPFQPIRVARSIDDIDLPVVIGHNGVNRVAQARSVANLRPALETHALPNPPGVAGIRFGHIDDQS